MTAVSTIIRFSASGELIDSLIEAVVLPQMRSPGHHAFCNPVNEVCAAVEWPRAIETTFSDAAGIELSSHRSSSSPPSIINYG